MPTNRRKLTAVYRDFNNEIKRLERLDRENQVKFSTSPGGSKSLKISKRQLHHLTEGLFFAGFRSFENFLRDVFLLYCLEKTPKTGVAVSSYLRPKDFNHAEMLIQSSKPFLDWANPSEIIKRAELYLDQGFPIKLPITSNQDALNDYKRIRNHIAHNSIASLDEYKKVLRKHLGTIPLIIPSPGEFLLVAEKRNPTKYKLLTFFEFVKTISQDLT